MLGKKLRMSRFKFPNSNKGILLPLDHGLTLGPIEGMKTTAEIAKLIQHPSICGVIVHKGIAERLIEHGALDGKGLMIHLNGMSSLSTTSDTKVKLTSIETAQRLGADGVSFQVNFDGTNDNTNLELMGSLVDEANQFALPILAMVYDKVNAPTNILIKRQRHLIRIALEMGCDAIKIAPPADIQLIPEILESLCTDIPIFFAGGTLAETNQMISMGEIALENGAAGFCIGRNIFQRPDYDTLLLKLKDLLIPKRLIYAAH